MDINNTNIKSNCSIINGNLILGEESNKYEVTFEVGDIVALKNNPKMIGVISLVDEDDKLVIDWKDTTQSEEFSCDLALIPNEIGLTLIEDTPLLTIWENLSNAKNDSFDLKCLYFNDLIVNEVTFIKAFKNTNTIVDKKFKRKFNLYRKFGGSQIFRTNIYTITNGEVGFDNSRYVYYLLQNNVVYYLGIDLTEQDLNIYLFNK